MSAADRALRAHLTFQRPSWLIRRLIVRDLRRFEHLATGRLLDIGCGQMPYRPLFPRVTAWVGIDHPNPHHPDDRPTAWASGLQLPFVAGAFDTVLATQVLEHVPEPGQLLAEIARVLRPGGVLLLTAPHIWDLHEQPYDYYRYTHYGLDYLLTRAGFRVEHIVAQGGFFVTAGQRTSYFVFRAFQKLRLRPVGVVGAFIANAVGLVLDRIYCYEGETLNYLAVARWPA